MARGRPGQLDQRIVIEKKLTTEDEGGGQTVDWGTLLEAWAEVIPQRGGEQARYDRVNAEFEYLFKIRARPDITIPESARVVWRGTTYNIRSIALPSTRGMYVEIGADRGVAV